MAGFQWLPAPVTARNKRWIEIKEGCKSLINGSELQILTSHFDFKFGANCEVQVQRGIVTK